MHQLEIKSNQIKHYYETKKRAHDSQIVRVKENLKLSYGGPSQRQFFFLIFFIWFFKSHQQSFSYIGTGLRGLNQY